MDLRNLWDVSTPAIRSFGTNQPLHLELDQLGSMLNAIHLLGLLVITVSVCSDIANELIYWLRGHIHTSARFCLECPDCAENTNVLTAIPIEMNGARGHFTVLE